MKRIFLVLTILLAGIVVSNAQENKIDGNKMVQERLANMKAQFKPSATEAKTFWKAYEEMRREVQRIDRRPNNLPFRPEVRIEEKPAQLGDHFLQENEIHTLGEAPARFLQDGRTCQTGSHHQAEIRRRENKGCHKSQRTHAYETQKITTNNPIEKTAQRRFFYC